MSDRLTFLAMILLPDLDFGDKTDPHGMQKDKRSPQSELKAKIPP
ncbi:MAG: hypothetical protein WBB82_01035 [Limnothrix sp.]